MKKSKLVTLSYEISENEFGDREMTFGYLPDLINLLKNIFTKAEPKEVCSFSVKVGDQTRPTKDVYSDLYEAAIVAVQDDQHFSEYFLGCEGCEETFNRLEEIMKIEPKLFDYAMKLFSFLKEIEQHFDPFEYDFDHHCFKQS
jgi:hypothetical protein